MTSGPQDELDENRTTCHEILRRLQFGFLMPFFGAGVNLTNRPDGVTFTRDGPFLPSASELSEDLAKTFGLKLENPCELPLGLTTDFRCKRKEESLLRVSWLVSATKSKVELYDHLHRIFSGDHPSTEVHKFFARFRQRLVKKGYEVRPQLIVTTNYDELLERAFIEAGEPFDVFTYELDRNTKRGKFIHTPHGAENAIPIDNPIDYTAEIEHTIILKIHGTANPKGLDHSTFVITEDDYIDYAAFVTFDKVPQVLGQKMLSRQFLYLGYSLSDWNLRVFLRGSQAGSHFPDKTWAIMKSPDTWDRLYWNEHRVKIVRMSLEDHIKILNEMIDKLPPRK